MPVSTAQQSTSVQFWFDLTAWLAPECPLKDLLPAEIVQAQSVVRRLIRLVAITDATSRQETFKYLSEVPEYGRYITVSNRCLRVHEDDALELADQAQRTTYSVGECCAALHRQGVPALVLRTGPYWDIPYPVAFGDRIRLPVGNCTTDWYGRLLALYPMYLHDQLQYAVIVVPDLLLEESAL